MSGLSCLKAARPVMNYVPNSPFFTDVTTEPQRDVLQRLPIVVTEFCPNRAEDSAKTLRRNPSPQLIAHAYLARTTRVAT
jgi:hypothetical protein